ncbi:TolC family outer membrane protein [Alcaligenaceae bacterium]|nr:TolC family outer membrane protein [Alcaligenaceae bacterium]
MRAAFTVARLLCLALLPSLWAGSASAANAATAAVRATPGTAAAPQGALTLSEAWLAALENDPTYKAAISEREAGQTNRAIGRAALLPQVGASLARTRVRGTLDSPGPNGSIVSTDLRYTSGVNEIHLNQVVFNWSTFAEYRQGQARADYSLAVFDTKANDTSERLLNRYFQTLLSYENLVLSQSKLDANEKQLVAAQHHFDGGEGTITDVHEAKSRRDLARADVIQAQDRLLVARRELQEMIGSAPVVLTTLKDDFKPQPLTPGALSDWQAMAMAGNAEVRTSEQGLRISTEEIDRTFGGHLPTLDIVASRRDVTSETLSTRNQDSNTTNLGIQVTVPLFSGGLTSAQVKQARHNRDRAAEELAATRERIAVEVTRHYQGVVSGAQRIAALQVAVESSKAALTATERSFEAGTRSMTDILDAQDQYYRSQLDLTQARLQYVLARLMLSGAAGTLSSTTIDTASQTYFGPKQVLLDAA